MGTPEEKPTSDLVVVDSLQLAIKPKSGPKCKADAPSTTILDTEVFDLASAPQCMSSRTPHLPPLSLIGALPTLERNAKRSNLTSPATSRSAVFISPPKCGFMKSNPVATSSNHTSIDLIVNDSFVQMADEKKMTGKFGFQYDDITSFLSKVIFQIFFEFPCDLFSLLYSLFQIIH